MRQTKHVKRLYILLVLSILLLGVILIYPKKDNYIEPINQMRVYVNQEYQSIQNLLEKNKSLMTLQPESLKSERIELDKQRQQYFIVGLDSVVYSSTHDEVHSGETVNLKHLLYMNDRFEEEYTTYFRVAFPLYLEGKVEGFVVFDVFKDDLNRYNKSVQDVRKDQLIILMIFIIWLLLVILGYSLFRQNSRDYEELITNIKLLSKGIMRPVSISGDVNTRKIKESFNLAIEELTYIMRQEKENERRRKVFLSKVSHELKTPIATIQAYVEGLTNGIAKDEETRTRYEETILTKMRQLMTQVNELFIYAQEETSEMKYNFEEYYIDELFDELSYHVNEESRVRILNQLPHCIVRADKTRMEQVFLNLYNNSKKHTKDNELIHIHAYREDNQIVIEFEDEGAGIDPKEISHIFEVYYQGESSSKNDYDGIGLGLAICKEIITKHEGSIRVRSKLGEGSCFIISIPIV